MLPLPILDSHAPAVRVMALHALAYCKRLFYLEEVEELRVASDRVFAGRALHAALEADEEGEAVSLELASEAMGLIGKVDCVRRRDGSYLPYEHKRGKPAKAGYNSIPLTPNPSPAEGEGSKSKTNSPAEGEGSKSKTNSPAEGEGSKAKSQWEAWPSDRLQLIAYAVLLEESTGQAIPEGRIRYHAANVAVRVPIDDHARQDLADAIAESRRLRESIERPPITENPRLCEKCSLAPVCLPEEVRQEREPERDPVRLFPPDRDGTTLHVVAQGTGVGISYDSIVVRPKDGPEVKHPARGIDTVLLHGFTQISTQAIRKCVEHGIGVHWLTVRGFRRIGTIRALGELYLGESKLTDTSFAGLKKLVNLKKLDVMDAPITDKSAPVLVAMKNLEELNLSGTKIGDPGVEQLKDLTKLKLLRLNKTNATRKSIDIIEAARGKDLIVRW